VRAISSETWPRLLLAGLVGLAVLLPPPSARAQLGGGGAETRIEGRVKFVPVPYLGYNRSFGISYGLVPLVMFNPVASDTLSPSSLAGGVAMGTANDTWFLLAFSQLYLAEDTWRLTAAGGGGSVNFQAYLSSPVDQWIPYNTSAEFVTVEAARRTWRDLFLGVTFIRFRLETSMEGLPVTLDTDLAGLGLTASVDRRSSVFYPRGGTYANLRYTRYPGWLDNEVTSSRAQLDVNHYRGFRSDRDVLASRFFAGLGIGDLDFNQQFIVGRVDVRGYTQGGYRGNYLLAAQTEYRWNFRARLGLVGFVGLATVFEAINEDDDGRLLPGIGGGFRFTAFTDTHMNVGMDVATGRDDWGVYFRIGEAY
jgi:hypothetical protein